MPPLPLAHVQKEVVKGDLAGCGQAARQGELCHVVWNSGRDGCEPWVDELRLPCITHGTVDPADVQGKRGPRLCVQHALQRGQRPIQELRARPASPLPLLLGLSTSISVGACALVAVWSTSAKVAVPETPGQGGVLPRPLKAEGGNLGWKPKHKQDHLPIAFASCSSSRTAFDLAVVLAQPFPWVYCEANVCALACCLLSACQQVAAKEWYLLSLRCMLLLLLLLL